LKVILGLGNPGREYEATRHNVGWWVLDHLADVWRLGEWRTDGEALAVSGAVAGHKVRLLKPQTYYNLSGQALRPFLSRENRDDLLALKALIEAGKVTPVTYRASSLARKSTALLMSTASIHGTGSTLSEANTGSTSARVGCSRSGRKTS